MSTRRKDRRPVTVTISDYTAEYGFLTSLADADSASLGHSAFTGSEQSTSVPVFFGANRPKPARARKKSDGTSSFYSHGTALPTGWVTSKKITLQPFPGSSAKSKYVYVKIDTNNLYVWAMPLDTYNSVGSDREGLGIKDLTSSDKGWLGANSIERTSAGKLGKPPRARKVVSGDTGTDIISTFCEFPVPANLPEGWIIS